MLTDHERQAEAPTDTNRYGLTEHEMAADREAMKARGALTGKPVERLVYTLDLDTSEAEAKLAHLSAMSSRIENLTKPWYTSKGIWGCILALISAGVGLAGYTIAPEDIEALTLALSAIGTAIGSILAIIGRVKADRAIG